MKRKLVTLSSDGKRRGTRAFSLMETVIAMAIIGIVFVGMLGGLNWVVSSVSWSREYSRATQLMAEKLDTLRLYSWEQLNSPGFVQTNFVATYNTLENRSAIGASARGTVYSGTITIDPAPVSEAYGSQMKRVTVGLTWQSGGRVHRSQMFTLVAQYGMQSFVY